MKIVPFFFRLYCVLFSALILWGESIHAAPVTLADAPLGTQARVPPTIVMTADDSGSMLGTFPSDTLPAITRACVVPGPTTDTEAPWTQLVNVKNMWPAEIVSSNYWNNGPYLLNASTSCGVCEKARLACEGGKQCCSMYAGPAGTEIIQATEGLCQNGQPPMLAAAFNGLTYNPLITYAPPKRGNASAAPFPSFDNTNGNLWSNVHWKNPSGTPAWLPPFSYSYTTTPGGSPINVDLTKQRCYYTTKQYNALTTDYMRGVTTAQLQNAGFQSATVGGVSAYSVPVHYYRTNVKWCKTTRSSTAFNGFADPGAIALGAGGTVSMSNCQDDYYNPPAGGGYPYPYYYSPAGINSASYANNQSTPAFDLVVFDLSTPSNPKLNIVKNGVTSNGLTSISHSYYDATTGEMKTITRTAKEEVTNYANWAAYYRNRVAATKTAASIAFTEAIPDQPDCKNPLPPRVGFNTLNNRIPAPASGFVNDFCGSANREAFINNVLLANAYSGTPMMSSFKALGDMFLNDSGNKLVKYACQRTSEILFTDGMWNETPGFTVGDHDGKTLATSLPALKSADPTTTPPTPATLAAGTVVYSTYGGGPLPGAGQNWPDPIRDHNNSSPTLADLALSYWMTPIGGSSVDNSAGGGGLISNTRKVAPTARDPATWPHLNFYGMGFGTRGTLPTLDQAAVLSKMGNGKTTAYSWPKVVVPGNNAEAADDFWHATVNGFGMFVSAQSTEEFSSGLKKILTEILNTGGANSGVGFTGADLTVGGQYTYTPSFSSGWSGDIVKKSINSTGQENFIPGQSTAAQLLAIKLMPTGSPPNMPWRDVRQIFTTVWSGGSIGKGTATPTGFTSGGVFGSSIAMTTLGTAFTQQTNVLAYLRGDRSREGDANGKFRVRGVGPLGDIVNASPVVVTVPSCVAATVSGAPPKCSYDEILNPGYQAFYNSNKDRDTMVYAAANDGMLHAFDGNLNEKWAYIPSDIFRPQAQAGIVNLTYQESDLKTPFTHYFYVDATPRVWDVYSDRDRKWKTVLIGGLGKGGTSYYALDVTDANAATTEGSTATQKVMWEFTDPDMGYTYGRALLVKTRAAAWGYKSDKDPDGKWVAILPSGHNNGSGNGQPKNGDGRGYIFFVDVDTGKLLHKVSTPAGFGSADAPLGIRAIDGYVEDYRNQLVTAVYGGDQQGNLWRFNLENTDYNKWTATRMAILQDKNGKPLHVTTEPWVQLVGNDRWLFVGTGGFRNDADLTAAAPTNTFYAFRDGTKANADTFTNRTRSDLVKVSGAASVTGEDQGKLKDNGWYEDMGTGYHLNVKPMATYEEVVYAANKYESNVLAGAGADPCASAVFTGKLYVRNIQATTLFGDYEFKAGIADVDLNVTEDGIAAAVTSMDGKGIPPGDPPSVHKRGREGNITRVPVKIGVRYINLSN